MAVMQVTRTGLMARTRIRGMAIPEAKQALVEHKPLVVLMVVMVVLLPPLVRAATVYQGGGFMVEMPARI